MGNASGTQKQAALVEVAQGMGGHSKERVHAAEVVAKTVCPLKDMGGKGVGLPCPTLSDAQHIVLQDIIDEALKSDTREVALTVAVQDPKGDGSVAFQLHATPVDIDNSWEWSIVHHAVPRDAEDAHLVLAGILPSRALVSAIPWGIVEGFAEMIEDAIVVTPVPSLLVPLILTCSLQRGGSVTVECPEEKKK